MTDDHECAFLGRPLRPAHAGERWVCPECHMVWTAAYGRDLPDRPRWVDPDSLGWRGRREVVDCRDLHETEVDGLPLVPWDHWGAGCPLEDA